MFIKLSVDSSAMDSFSLTMCIRSSQYNGISGKNRSRTNKPIFKLGIQTMGRQNKRNEKNVAT
jgi:hypothetical protein